MENKGNGKTIALIVLGMLTAFGLVVELINSIRYHADYTSGSFLNPATYIAACLLLFYYAVAGYKKPHGNLLKYLFLLFAVCCLGSILTVVTEQTALDIAFNYIRGVVVLLTAFVAGRLDHFKQNVILMSIIGVLMLASSITQIPAELGGDFISLFWCFTFFLQWVNLMFAYILRYKEHKEAGLTDK